MRTWTIPRACVIATHNRRAELRRAVEAIAPQCDYICVIDNASEPPIAGDYELSLEWSALVRECVIDVVRDEEQPPNLSRLWNIGIDRYQGMFDALAEVTRNHPARWDIAILNDDAVPPPGWFDAVAGAMRDHGADAASSDPFDQMPPGMTAVMHTGAPMGVHTRLAGWAMVLCGEWSDARFDEDYRWWCGDDDMSLRARRAGGLVHVGGFPVPNTGADTSTVGALAEQAARDMQTFVDKHGRRPW